MKTVLLCSLIMLVVVPTESQACGWLPAAEQAQQDAEDLRKQRLLAKELADEADSIFVAHARAVAVASASHATLQEGTVIAKFTVDETLKGAERSEVELSWLSRISIGCHASASFRNVQLRPGLSYLVYAKRGSILRAGPVKRTRGQISFRQERRLVRSRAGV